MCAGKTFLPRQSTKKVVFLYSAPPEVAYFRDLEGNKLAVYHSS